MNKVRIVTDSTAHFEDPSTPARLGISVVPLSIQVGERFYRDGIDIRADNFFSTIFHDGDLESLSYPMGYVHGERTIHMPRVFAPGTEDFSSVYAELGRSADRILSIHNSSKLTQTYVNARMAADAMLGRCQITAVDSMTTSFGLGILVEQAARAAEAGKSMDDIIRLVRGIIPRIYAVFFVETLDFLEKGGRIGRAQAILGAMLGIKLFLTIEDGELIPMEKVRTRDKGVEKLVEFVTEFTCIDRIAIMQSTPEPAEETRLLLDRLAAEFPSWRVPVLVCGPTLASILGPHSLGVIVYEGAE